MTTADSDVTSLLAGVGRHEHYLSYSQLARALEYTVLGEAVFGLSLAFARISISLVLLRIISLSRGKKEKKKLPLEHHWTAIIGRGSVLGSTLRSTPPCIQATGSKDPRPLRRSCYVHKAYLFQRWWYTTQKQPSQGQLTNL